MPIVDLKGNHLYRFGNWRLYWRPNRDYVYIWYGDGSPAIEIINSNNGWWHWRADDQHEYTVFPPGNMSKQAFYERVWAWKKDELPDLTRGTTVRGFREVGIGGNFSPATAKNSPLSWVILGEVIEAGC